MLTRSQTFIIFPLLALAMACLSSCREDNDHAGSGSGFIAPKVEIDQRIVSPEAQTLAELGFDVPAAGQLGLAVVDATSGNAATWPSVADYPQDMPLLAGEYILTASTGHMSEGGVNPTLEGSLTVTVADKQTAAANIVATVSNTLISTRYASAQEMGGIRVELSYHSSAGGAFIDAPASAQLPLLLAPGRVTRIAYVEMPDGRRVRLSAGAIEQAQAAHHYIVNVSIDASAGTPELVIATEPEVTDALNIPLDEALFAAVAPEIEAVGFKAGESIDMVEGGNPMHEIAMEVKGHDITALTLYTHCPYMADHGIPPEVDLLDPDVQPNLAAYGLRLEGNKVVFNDVISHLTYAYGRGASTFTLVAADAAGRLSEPVTLAIKIADAELNVVRAETSLVGSNEGTILVATNAAGLTENVTVRTLNPTSGQWTEAPITDVDRTDQGTYRITFPLPDGTAPVPVRLYFCGELKAETSIVRVSPQFSIEVDAYARAARIKVTCPGNPNLVPVITHYADIYVNGAKSTVMARDTRQGFIDIVGLSPDKRYEVCATVLQSPTQADFTPTVTVSTEKTEQVPNGDFEETRTDIKYKDLPSGGRYSQTIVDIFNEQNHVSFNTLIPKEWANINAKTFCTAAANHNTWYMHPSAQAVSDAQQGGFAMEVVNTAWDTSGPAIPDYAQTAQPYIRYNPFIPEIAHRAAGRVWLGAYSFNPITGTETITEGVKFGSRPSSLNGYYKYLPGKIANSERALIQVKIWGIVDGKETLIADSRTTLGISPDYSTFSVPLSYNHFGVKATKMCIIISASSSIGDIDYESAHVITNSDPVTATSTGNRLRVDNLTFAY